MNSLRNTVMAVAIAVLAAPASAGSIARNGEANEVTTVSSRDTFGNEGDVLLGAALLAGLVVLVAAFAHSDEPDDEDDE